MEIEFTKLSSKGQIVIPKKIREKLHLEDGTPFAVVEQGEEIIIKKIKMPEIKSWNEIARPFREAAKKSGFTKEDLDRIIKEVRRVKQ